MQKLSDEFRRMGGAAAEANRSLSAYRDAYETAIQNELARLRSRREDSKRRRRS